MTYQEIVDYIYHRCFQNTSTDAIKQSDVVMAINSGIYVVSSQISHPLLSISVQKESESSEILSDTFNFDSSIKKVSKLYGWKSDSDSFFEIKQVFSFADLEENDDNYYYICYNNIIKLNKELRKISLKGEMMLPYIESNSESLSTIFPLDKFFAYCIAEYAMSILVPVNIIDGYNVAQYHENRFYKMLEMASRNTGNISGYKQIRNNIK